MDTNEAVVREVRDVVVGVGDGSTAVDLGAEVARLAGAEADALRERPAAIADVCGKGGGA